MYNLVNDVESYPQFLPWCRRATILEQSETTLKAQIEVVKGPIHKQFTTQNLLSPGREIQLQLVDGPFRQLNGRWRFDALDEEASQVSLFLEFEFSNRILALSLGPLFQQIGNTMVDAFTRRARALYG